MSEKLYFAGQDLTGTLGLSISGPGVYNAPARTGESISVPGRNGDIWVDGGSFENIDVVYPAWICDGFRDKIDLARGFLMQHSDGYYKISDSYHPSEYRLGRFAGAFDVETGTSNMTGKFNLTFNCQPQRWLNSGDEIMRSSERENPSASSYPYTPDILGDGSAYVQRLMFENPTLFPAYPRIRFQCATGPEFVLWTDLGADSHRVLYIRKIKFEPLDEYVIFDFQTMQAELPTSVAGVFEPVILDFEVTTYVTDGETQFYIYPGFLFTYLDEIRIASQETYLDSEVAFIAYPRWYNI